MQYLKSHQDQKVRPYASKAIREGFEILEIDLQQAMGKIVLGHNWRPKLPYLFDCTLEQYMDRLIEEGSKKTLFIQLDIKEICLTNKSKTSFVRDVVKVLDKYKNKVVFLPSANEGLGRPKIAEALHSELLGKGFLTEGWLEWQEKIGRDNIVTKDLW